MNFNFEICMCMVNVNRPNVEVHICECKQACFSVGLEPATPAYEAVTRSIPLQGVLALLVVGDKSKEKNTSTPGGKGWY